MERYPVFSTAQLRKVEMPIIPKLIHRFNVNTIKITRFLFVEIETISNSMQRSKRARISTTLKMESEVGRCQTEESRMYDIGRMMYTWVNWTEKEPRNRPFKICPIHFRQK